jgi:hypothetical protein
MITHCVINFLFDGREQAKLYRSSEFYPESQLLELRQFFKAAKKQEVQLSNPGDLATKYVVWQAHRQLKLKKKIKKIMSSGKINPENSVMDFDGLGISLNDPPGGIDFIYNIHCDRQNKNGKPVVTWRPVGRS